MISYVWELPKVATSNGFLRTVLHGWQVTGIGQYQTGGPFNITSGQDNSRTGLNPDRAKLTDISPSRRPAPIKPCGSIQPLSL